MKTNVIAESFLAMDDLDKFYDIYGLTRMKLDPTIESLLLILVIQNWRKQQ